MKTGRPKSRHTPNWIEIRNKYVTHPDISIEDLADDFRLSAKSIYIRAKKEGWQKLREENSNKITEKVSEKIGMTIAEYQAKKFNDGMTLSDTAMPHFVGAKRIGPLTAVQAIQAGHKMATEALGLDNPKIVNKIQNNNFSIVQLMEKAIETKQKEYED